MRYDDPVQIPGAFYEGLAPRGPLVLPGKYMVTLGVDGRSRSVALVIAEDPRVHGSPDGLRRKFALAMQAYHGLDAPHRAVNDIRAVKGEIVGVLRKPGPTSTGAAPAAQGDAITRQDGKIEDKLMQIKITGSEGDLNYPGMLNEQIYAYTELLDDADTAPNAQEISTYAALHAELAVQLAPWKRLKET